MATIIPKHIAIIMDGNGRWAKKRLLPRVAGHVRGVKRVKEIVACCAEIGVQYLTLFAFGRENWRRPQDEVSFLMKLLYDQLGNQLVALHEQNVRVRFIGDRTRLGADLIQKIVVLEDLTKNNDGLYLSIALDYSGTYDITQAVNQIIANKAIEHITESDFERFLLSYPYPAPDLLIRTSGESRISNFMLWQIAYSEIFITTKLWPDFTAKVLHSAIEWFNNRERRFGMTSEQIQDNQK